MTLDLALFLILALVAVATALGMLFSKNAVYSALFLVLNFVTVAVFYLLLGAPFIAMAQITVYAGAIMVLFLFVIMLLGAERLPATNVLPWQRPLAITLTVILAMESTYLLLSRARPSGSVLPPGAEVNTVDNLRAMAMTLFNNYLLPFEVTSVLLLVAMVGVIVLVRREKGQKS
ncbi:MAG: NADH-quinone oxidoreductase subunit J [Chloroflexota bacterium]|nr:NADH-quinone oxidoreductase subunit J [Chloroflexota bacterium]MBI5702602.1 NADH-quinone oxidoreductase subunit J [Chloroflexota bacterium]